MYLNSDRPNLDGGVGQLARDWLNGAVTAPGWVNGADEPPPLTPGQVDARIRIARRFLALDGRTADNWDEPRPLHPDDMPPGMRATSLTPVRDTARDHALRMCECA